jgi:hypothetical protein
MTKYKIIVGKEINYDFFIDKTVNIFYKLTVGREFEFHQYEDNPLLNLNQSLQFSSAANIVALGILISKVKQVISGEIESTYFPLEDVLLCVAVTKDRVKEDSDEGSIPTSDFLQILEMFKVELDEYYSRNPKELESAIEYYNSTIKYL